MYNPSTYLLREWKREVAPSAVVFASRVVPSETAYGGRVAQSAKRAVAWTANQSSIRSASSDTHAMNTDAQSGLAWICLFFVGVLLARAVVYRVDGVSIQQQSVLMVCWCAYLAIPGPAPVALEWAIVGVAAVLVLATLCCVHWCCNCVTLWEPLVIFIVSTQTAWVGIVSVTALETTERMHLEDAVPVIDRPTAVMYAPHVVIGFAASVLWLSLWRCVRSRHQGYTAVLDS